MEESGRWEVREEGGKLVFRNWKTERVNLDRFIDDLELREEQNKGKYLPQATHRENSLGYRWCDLNGTEFFSSLTAWSIPDVVVEQTGVGLDDLPSILGLIELGLGFSKMLIHDKFGQTYDSWSYELGIGAGLPLLFTRQEGYVLVPGIKNRNEIVTDPGRMRDIIEGFSLSASNNYGFSRTFDFWKTGAVVSFDIRAAAGVGVGIGWSKYVGTDASKDWSWVFRIPGYDYSITSAPNPDTSGVCP